VDLRRIQDGIREQVVGREEEAQLLLAALGAGRDLLLEGPPGTSKSTLLRAVTALNGTSLRFIEGNADLTPSKLVGHHIPARVLQEDYNTDNFVYGPLPLAMREGGLLYIEELNRVPEDTLNALLTAMAERDATFPLLHVVATGHSKESIYCCRRLASFGGGRCAEIKTAAGIPAAINHCLAA
jgi:MoxR-like ATPase